MKPSNFRAILTTAALATAGLLTSATGWGAVPLSTTIEGALLSAGGGPAADGTYGMVVSIYTAETGGSPVWTEGPLSVVAKSGGFSMLLGSKTPLSPAALNLQNAWIGVQVGTDPELPRRPAGSSLFALRAAVAEALECSGCVKAGALDAAVLQPYAKTTDLSVFAKAADLGAYAKTTDLAVFAKVADLAAYAKSTDLAAYAKSADLADYVKAASLAKVAGTGSYTDLSNTPNLAKVATSGSYADLANKPAIPATNSLCGTGLFLKGFNADGSINCLALKEGDMPADGINEVSNGLIHNQFVDSTAGTPNVKIPDGLGAGTTDSLVFPDIGIAQKISVTMTIANSDMTGVRVELYGPGISTPYVLYNGGKTGTTLAATFNDTTAIVSGDLNTDWVGKNIKGNWSITVKDLKAGGGSGTPATDGTFNWAINIQTLSNKKVQIKGNLLVDGSVKVGTDAATCDSTKVGALRWNNTTIEVCTGSEWRPHANGVTYTRWGRKDCPTGSTLLWKGWAAGAHYQHGGSGGNTLCLVEDPAWPAGYQYNDTNNDNALIYGTEYESNGAVAGWNGNHDYDMGCAVCFAETKNAQVVVPGKPTCPTGWSAEYTGYIVAENYTHAKAEWLCVDKDMQPFGSNANSNGNLWYLAEVECGALPCGPYVQNRELTCAVCSR